MNKSLLLKEVLFDGISLFLLLLSDELEGLVIVDLLELEFVLFTLVLIQRVVLGLDIKRLSDILGQDNVLDNDSLELDSLISEHLV